MDSSNTDNLTVPASLMAAIRSAADEENRSAPELVRDAVEQYLSAKRWQQLLAFGEAQARKLGLSEADVPRLIAEARRESRNGH